MITYSTKYRSKQSEIMDDFNLQGEEMKVLLSDLERVNRLLGGYGITCSGIEYLLKDWPKDTPVRLLDIGCGDGAMLRHCGDWALKNGYKVHLIGVDANPHILEEAKVRSAHFRNSTFNTVDVFNNPQLLPAFDIALCTLFLHHFPNDQITSLLKDLSERGKVGVVVNDLHRSRLAFWLFKLFAMVFIKTRIARHDGQVSVARGFKRYELKKISEKINRKDRIRWKWAFRYQWIIESNKTSS